MLVDENMFYKGVDKRTVHEARLHQTSSVSDPEDTTKTPASVTGNLLFSNPVSNGTQEDSGHPPYPFSSGDTLLALTRKHNVSRIPYVLAIATRLMIGGD